MSLARMGRIVVAGLAAFAAAGVQHVVSAPWRTGIDDWLRSMDLLAELVL